MNASSSGFIVTIFAAVNGQLTRHPAGISSSSRDDRRIVPPGWGETIASATPLGRIAGPRDVARVIAFFAGEGGDYVTGVRAPVDVGMGLAQLAFIRPRHS